MGKLYIVGTPIGNLEDITLRAIKTLREVDVIACEDTRNTRKLLTFFEISGKKLITYNNFTEKNGSKGIVKLIKENNFNVALVSDAGMPVISDPGFMVIKEARINDIEIELIPGVSAVTSAFVLSNFSNIFSFMGFLKDKTIQRKNELKTLVQGTYVYFVSPHKLYQTLVDINEILEEKATIFLAKELTKIHEQYFFGKPSEVLNYFTNDSPIKGEYTLVINIKKDIKNKKKAYK